MTALASPPASAPIGAAIRADGEVLTGLLQPDGVRLGHLPDRRTSTAQTTPSFSVAPGASLATASLSTP